MGQSPEAHVNRFEKKELFYGNAVGVAFSQGSHHDN
jgi:hypothetical protein